MSESASMIRKYLFLLLIFFPLLSMYSQDNPKVKDSTNIYEKIEEFSKKRKVTRTLYSWLFKHQSENLPKNPDRPRENYDHLEGKIIRDIIIDTKDPFGYSIVDSTKTPKKWMERAGNFIHIKSKDFAIRNYLLVKRNEPLNILKMHESARLLRTQEFIRDAIIIPLELIHTKDSIDLIITSLDAWSLIPEVSISQTKAGGKIKDRNILGLGHEFEFGYLHQLQVGNNAYDMGYIVPNIKNTFISASGKYVVDFEDYFQKYISVDRTFYSPLTQWAGGVFFEERSLARPLLGDSLQLELQDLRYSASDLWGAVSFPLKQSASDKMRSNLIFGFRTFFVDYLDTPPLEFDRIRFFSKETFVLGSIGVSSRQYIEDYYIFKDGYTEDVPTGFMYSLTLGNQKKRGKSRLYTGLRFSQGSYYSFGFLSGNFEFGTFFNNYKSEQTAISIQINYFSNLMSLGNWKWRQFVKPQVIIGINRLDSPADRLSLNQEPYYTGSEGKIYEMQDIGTIRGFESYVFGNNKYVLDLQSQFYAPWALWGFRINPYANISVGMMTNKEPIPGSNKLYASFGLGCIIRNDYLLFESFQFSFAFYPDIPIIGENVFKWNTFESEDFGFQDFQINKPRPVFYR